MKKLGYGWFMPFRLRVNAYYYRPECSEQVNETCFCRYYFNRCAVPEQMIDMIGICS